MQLVKLELNGFKSFARKTELVFEPGITSIIGPNGSGKSNIADAVRWVLGEQSARTLRGTKMEDVIFNGSELRKPQSYCDVSLTFDNSDGMLPVDFNEVTVTRRVYRSGESEYLLNRNECRLKDILDLFRDTGIGKEGYSIISQGRVDDILSNKSTDRRAVLEEAAGIMRYRVRKEEAERKLSSTRDNITRIDDIIAEISSQLESLWSQSEVAKEYLKLRDELKSLELNVFIYQYERIRQRMGETEGTSEQLDVEAEQYAADERSIIEAITQAQAAADEFEQRISEQQRSLMELSTGAESRLGELKVFHERAANITAANEKLDEDALRFSNQLETLMQALEASTALINTKQAELAALQVQVEAAQAQAKAADETIVRSEEALEKEKTAMMDALNRLSDAKSSESRLTAMKAAFDQRLASGKEGVEKVKSELASLEDESSEAYAELEVLDGEKKRAQQAKDALITQINELRAKQRELNARAADIDRTLHQERTRQTMLTDMKRAYEGFYTSIKRLLYDCGRNDMLRKSVLGVVAELISVPAELETAIEMALGPALQNIVTPSEDDAKRIIEHLRLNSYGRATCLPLNIIKGRTLTDQELRLISREGCLGVASQLIGYDKKYSGVMDSLLGRTVIVRDLDTGIALMRERAQFRIATLKGDIINVGGAMTGGSVQKKEFSLLGRERELAEVEKRIDACAREHLTLLDQSAALDKSAAALEAQLGEADELIHQCDITLMRQHEKIDMLKKYTEDMSAQMTQINQEREQLQDNIADIDAQLEAIQQLRGSLEKGSVASQQDILDMQNALSAQRAQRDAHFEALSAYKVELMGLDKERTALEQELRRTEREADQARREAARCQAERVKGEAALEKLAEQIREFEAQLNTERGEVDERTLRLSELENVRAENMALVRDLRTKRESVSDALKDVTERRHRAQINLSRYEVELEAMQERIADDYMLTYEAALEYRRPIQVTAANTRIDELRSMIRELGDVNVSAIEDYKNRRERHDTLMRQREDLVQAEADLNELIAELLASMETQLKEQFSLINRNFGIVFKELFGGGSAYMELSDENDILNCDINIVAQPPGKKLQLLSLLSGGEKALTSIALLFAMLRLKPTPFCVLDEIESALDEANVLNFASYLKNYSDRTQFILITHRKGSMEASNTLYGVAMEEKGISKIVSVRFGDDK